MSFGRFCLPVSMHAVLQGFLRTVAVAHQYQATKSSRVYQNISTSVHFNHHFKKENSLSLLKLMVDLSFFG